MSLGTGSRASEGYPSPSFKMSPYLHTDCQHAPHTNRLCITYANYVNSWRRYCLRNNDKSSLGRFHMDAIFSWMFFMFQIKSRASLMLNKYSASQLQMCPKYFQIEVERICIYGTHGDRESTRACACVCMCVCMCLNMTLKKYKPMIHFSPYKEIVNCLYTILCASL